MHRSISPKCLNVNIGTLLIYYDILINLYSRLLIFYYLTPQHRIVIALCIKRLLGNEVAEYLYHFLTARTGYGRRAAKIEKEIVRACVRAYNIYIYIR
jgi:hypothetical protein